MGRKKKKNQIPKYVAISVSDAANRLNHQPPQYQRERRHSQYVRKGISSSPRFRPLPPAPVCCSVSTNVKRNSPRDVFSTPFSPPAPSSRERNLVRRLSSVALDKGEEESSREKGKHLKNPPRNPVHPVLCRLVLKPPVLSHSAPPVPCRLVFDVVVD
ncbi:hypothetical protein N658DRAFT_12282 [Parathielavia hyrcaniae]|uniref:Uncharacterized protein n=1 Tax=Parathielavia hyrcaniae TaxID=113614 RepID=A0AAN6QFF3_9PEZI|nr:hypothetical protein N658DRAFT_12282 [Parathielavia hyrcaniae]